MSSREELFCHIDDFCQRFEPWWKRRLLDCGACRRERRRSLSLSEIMTILVLFHQSSYRNFKHFYPKQLKEPWQQAFLGLVSYQRFVEWIPSALSPLCTYLKHGFGRCTGISFIDATSAKSRLKIRVSNF